MTTLEKKRFIGYYESQCQKQDERHGEDYVKIEQWLEDNEELYLQCLSDISEINYRDRESRK